MNIFNDPSESRSWKDTIVHASRPVRIAATFALSMLALFLLVATVDGLHNWGQADTMGPDTITVSGDGTATAVPDTASISFGETVTAADAATAQSKMSTTMNAAIDAVVALGISKDDITTTSYNVSPHYAATVCPAGVYCGGSSEVSGYDVSEMVNVKVKDTTKVSGILGALAKANITNVSGPDYVVGDTQQVMQTARAQAIQKAQADAQKLATQLGVKLGKIQSFQDNTSGSGPQPMYKATAAMDSMAAAPAPSVPTGTNTYTDSVSITYEIH